MLAPSTAEKRLCKAAFIREEELWSCGLPKMKSPNHTAGAFHLSIII